MSDEEEDEEVSMGRKQKIFRVSPRGCYSEELTIANQQLDALYTLHLRPALGPRGNVPARRAYSSPTAVSSHQHVAIGLPINCYSYEWLKGLSPAEREKLQVDHQSVELHIPAHLQRPKERIKGTTTIVSLQ